MGGKEVIFSGVCAGNRHGCSHSLQKASPLINMESVQSLTLQLSPTGEKREEKTPFFS